MANLRQFIPDDRINVSSVNHSESERASGREREREREREKGTRESRVNDLAKVRGGQ